MKVATIKNAVAGLGGSCLILALSLLPVASASAANSYPYFKVYGADVATGGWINTASGLCTSVLDGYQDSNYTDNGTQAATQLAGGIMAYAKSSGNTAAGGASSQYAATSEGTIDNTPGTPSGGFYSDGSAAQSGSAAGVSQLSFANFGSIGSNSWGGGFDGDMATPPGSPADDQCIPDYYDTFVPTTANNLGAGGLAPTGQASGFYTDNTSGGNPFEVTSNGTIIIPPAANISVFVNGNVYISNNITYAAHDANSVPKFALVVQGNIYIAPNVTQLDGWYIAQPVPPPAGSPDSNDGTIWTCHPNSDTGNTNIDGNFMATNCSQQLVVNGSLTAKQVNLTRVNGDINGAGATAGEGSSSPNVAEVINYTPDMVIGGGFFQTTGQTNKPQIDSLLSLPPVF